MKFAINFKGEGFSNDTCFKDEQKLNAYWLIDDTEEGIDISFREVHPWKAYESIIFTEFGIDICTNDWQLKKIWFPNDSICVGYSKITFSKDKQFENTYSFIFLTEEGIEICFKDIQEENAYKQMSVKEEFFSNFTSFNDFVIDWWWNIYLF